MTAIADNRCETPRQEGDMQQNDGFHRHGETVADSETEAQ